MGKENARLQQQLAAARKGGGRGTGALSANKRACPPYSDYRLDLLLASGAPVAVDHGLGHFRLVAVHGDGPSSHGKGRDHGTAPLGREGYRHVPRPDDGPKNEPVLGPSTVTVERTRDRKRMRAAWTLDPTTMAGRHPERACAVRAVDDLVPIRGLDG